jgi:hypothetical protein
MMVLSQTILRRLQNKDSKTSSSDSFIRIINIYNDQNWTAKVNYFNSLRVYINLFVINTMEQFSLMKPRCS